MNIQEPTEQDASNIKKKFKYKGTEEERAERKKQRRIRRDEYKSNKNTSFTGTFMDHTEYYFENGLRKVKPYFYKWETTAKERWFGKTLIELYSTEFSRAVHHIDINSYMDSGKILINSEKKPRDYRLKNGDVITNFKHRHELPVIGDPIEVVCETDDILAINKPCSIPMHPCGKYRYNSLMLILVKEMNYQNLRTVFRIDRLTSGLVVFPKNFETAKLLDKQIKDRSAIKTYLCRVLGEFPSETLTVDQPIDCLSRKTGIQWICKEGKSASTIFERLSFNGKSSVVKCMPKTGRTHQIRVHLQYLGHPIVNDPLYNDKDVWGESNGKSALFEKKQEEIERSFLSKHQQDAWLIDNDQVEIDCDNKDEKVEQSNQEQNDELGKRKAEDESELDPKKRLKSEDEKDPHYDPECYECKNKFKDPSRKDLTMYLHALSYKFGDMEFKTKMPKWADENFDDCE